MSSTPLAEPRRQGPGSPCTTTTTTSRLSLRTRIGGLLSNDPIYVNDHDDCDNHKHDFNFQKRNRKRKYEHVASIYPVL